MIDKIKGNRIANDISTPLISLLKAIQNNWNPPDKVTLQDYENAKFLNDNDPLKGFIGFLCSFSAIYFSSYISSDVRDYVAEAKRNLDKQKHGLKGIQFENKNYHELIIPKNSIIYCDIPYKNTRNYKIKFDYDKFYNWCKEQHEKNNKIFVSEYEMPNEFTCVWEKKVRVNLNNKKTNSLKLTSTKTEKLFVLK